MRAILEKTKFWLKSHFGGAYAEAHAELLKAQEELNHVIVDRFEELEARIKVLEELEARIKVLEELEARIKVLEGDIEYDKPVAMLHEKSGDGVVSTPVKTGDS